MEGRTLRCAQRSGPHRLLQRRDVPAASDVCEQAMCGAAERYAFALHRGRQTATRRRGPAQSNIGRLRHGATHALSAPRLFGCSAVRVDNRFCRNSSSSQVSWRRPSCSASQRVKLHGCGRGVAFTAVHLPLPDHVHHVHLYGRLPVMQVRFQCWLARYEVADLYPAFVAGVSMRLSARSSCSM